jgi:hypothetical protein
VTLAPCRQPSVSFYTPLIGRQASHTLSSPPTALLSCRRFVSTASLQERHEDWSWGCVKH